MPPVRSASILAATASLLVPPRLARWGVVAILALAGGLAAGFAISDRLAGGLVTEVFPQSGAPQLVTVASPIALPIGTPPPSRAVLLPETLLPAPVVGDLILASGIPDHAESGSFLSAQTVTVLPLTTWSAQIDARRTAAPFKGLQPFGPILAAIALTLFATAALRLTLAAVIGGVTGLTALALWHLGAATVVPVLPPAGVRPFLLGAAVVGLVIGWRALSPAGGGAIHRLGSLAAALILVPPVGLGLALLTGFPQGAILPLLLVAAVLRPSLVPAALAVPLLDHALELPPEGLLAASVGIAGLRLWLDRGHRGHRVEGWTQDHRAGPAAGGAFDPARIVDPRQET